MERQRQSHGSGPSADEDEGSSRPALQLAPDQSGHAPDRPTGGGVLVEFVRLIIVTLFAAGGWEASTYLYPAGSDRHLIGILIGSGVGYVLGGVFGRRTASAVSELEREFRRIPAAEILAGGIGLIVGLVLATLL